MRKCLICKSKTKIKFQLKEAVILKCLNCGFEARNILSKTPADDIYDDSYFNLWGLTEYQKIKTATFQLLLNKTGVKDFKNLTLLDVGCANGLFLKTAVELGMKTYGIEYSEAAAKQARRNVPEAEIITGDIIKAELNGKFDIVVLADVIEHLNQPLQLFQKLKELTAKNGIIVITTPNPDSLAVKIFGKYCPIYMPEHLVFFSKKSLMWIAKKFGFEVLRLEKNEKKFNLNYLIEQLIKKNSPLFVLMAKIAKFLIPGYFRRLAFKMKSGEYLVIYRN